VNNESEIDKNNLVIRQSFVIRHLSVFRRTNTEPHRRSARLANQRAVAFSASASEP
jgi:hypothetical protein